MVTRYAESAATAYTELAGLIDEHHGSQVFSIDGSTIDDIVANRLAGHQIATAESCTGGMIAARLTDRAGSSAYVIGAVVSYANEVKSNLLDVSAETIEEHGAVSERVAAMMAEGVLSRLGVDIAVSTSGIAGPGVAPTSNRSALSASRSPPRSDRPSPVHSGFPATAQAYVRFPPPRPCTCSPTHWGRPNNRNRSREVIENHLHRRLTMPRRVTDVRGPSTHNSAFSYHRGSMHNVHL